MGLTGWECNSLMKGKSSLLIFMDTSTFPRIGITCYTAYQCKWMCDFCKDRNRCCIFKHNTFCNSASCSPFKKNKPHIRSEWLSQGMFAIAHSMTLIQKSKWQCLLMHFNDARACVIGFNCTTIWLVKCLCVLLPYSSDHIHKPTGFQLGALSHNCFCERFALGENNRQS